MRTLLLFIALTLGVWAQPDIDVGTLAGNEALNSVAASYIDFANPANASGTLDSIVFHFHNDPINLQITVGTFYISGSDTVLRDTVVFRVTGSANVRTAFYVGDRLSVEAGDVLGWGTVDNIRVERTSDNSGVSIRAQAGNALSSGPGVVNGWVTGQGNDTYWILGVGYNPAETTDSTRRQYELKKARGFKDFLER